MFVTLPMARLLCGLPMIVYISYSVSLYYSCISGAFGYQVAAILCSLGYWQQYLLLILTPWLLVVVLLLSSQYS
jgi:uncharacterized membrane protein